MEVPSANRTRVYLVLAFGLAFISISPILVRLVGDSIPGVAVAVWRTVLAALVLTPFVVAGKAKDLRTIERREWLYIIAAGFLLGVHFLTWIQSLYHTSVASASVLVAMSPLFLAVLGYLFLKERLSLKTNTAIVLAVSGSALMGYAARGDSMFPNAMFGNGLALFAALAFSVYLLIGRVIRSNRSWLAYVYPVYFFAAVTCLGWALISGVQLFGYGIEIYGMTLLMALGPQIAGHGSLNYAVKFMPAAIIGLASLAEPLIASVIAYFLFDEVPGGLALIGMLIVLIAITSVLIKGKKDSG